MGGTLISHLYNVSAVYVCVCTEFALNLDGSICASLEVQVRFYAVFTFDIIRVQFKCVCFSKFFAHFLPLFHTNMYTRDTHD